MIVAPRSFDRDTVLAKLDELKVPVFLLDASSLEQYFLAHHQLARNLDRSTIAHAMTQAMRQRTAEISSRTEHLPRTRGRLRDQQSAARLPSAPAGTYINDWPAGGINIASGASSPYPRSTMETVSKDDPESDLSHGVGRKRYLGPKQEWRRWTTLSGRAAWTAYERSRPMRSIGPGPRVMEGLEELAKVILILRPSPRMRHRVRPWTPSAGHSPSPVPAPPLVVRRHCPRDPCQIAGYDAPFHGATPTASTLAGHHERPVDRGFSARPRLPAGNSERNMWGWGAVARVFASALIRSGSATQVRDGRHCDQRHSPAGAICRGCLLGFLLESCLLRRLVWPCKPCSR